MKYRKKPVVIEAVQFQGEDGGTWLWSDKPGWFTRAIEHGNLVLEPERRGPDGRAARVQMRTIHGDVAYARLQDWIVPETRAGCFYPVDPDIFATTYDIAEELA